MPALLPGLPLQMAALAMAVFVLAGAVKGVIGLGLPTFSMALLALWMPPAQAAALLLLPSLCTNLWQAGPLATLGALWRRLWPMQTGVLLGTLGGVLLFGPPAGRAGAALLGLALAGYALWGLAGRRLPQRMAQARGVGPLVGVLTGLLTALTGVFVLPAVPWLQSLSLDKDELVQAMGLSFTTSTVALGLGLGWAGGADTAASLWASLWMLPAAALGILWGQRLRARLSQAVFRRCFFVALLALGVWMLWRAVAA
ncbi:sulfite exporter TauE/SafE family protein [Xenophilus arseniciresistens]|uniref:Probable membrane transporter protein n=2 Tax=Xenophilus arseniciresistens TaxID=1283306 RepID=A0AAE3N3Y0_9BURK|nr:sulfite exporter TauE/SafE family protein [Xenophilus arseniciresistens]MDA7415075.1 sulfite exporter TauE/SafE family protein [Xenophilus arseniciresistens]